MTESSDPREAIRRLATPMDLESMTPALARALATIDEAIFVVDRGQGTIVSCNAAVERIFGYAPTESIGDRAASLYVDPESYEAFQRRAHEELAKTGISSPSTDRWSCCSPPPAPRSSGRTSSWSCNWSTASAP